MIVPIPEVGFANYPSTQNENDSIVEFMNHFNNKPVDKNVDNLKNCLTLGEKEMINNTTGINENSFISQKKEYISSVSNQWVNPHTSTNMGTGTIQKTAFVNRVVNFWECAATANDPIFVRIFRLLTQQTMNEGYDLFHKDRKKVNKKVYNQLEETFDIETVMAEAISLSFSVGGCLVYLDTEENDLERLKKPITDSEYRMIKRLTPISPLMLGAKEVNSTDPTSALYMRPQIWYVAGKGEIHSSRFVYFSHNEPVKTLLPLSLYFGIPYTQSLVADVANIHSISQNLAQLVARFRERYIKTNRRNFNSTQARNKFLDRIKTMVMMGNNFSLSPILDDEDIVQLISPINGLENFIESEALVLCMETGLSMTKLMGVQSKGFGNKNEGDQNNFIETIIGTQKQFEKSCSQLYNAGAKAIGVDDVYMKFKKPEKILLDKEDKKPKNEEKDVKTNKKEVIKDEKDS